ncbi:MAG: hypothetical protein ACJAUH_001369 [Saprospiraceae bacterium]|jgi:hypothetical protein|tara:strand:+ start:1761 stop:1946 length:186 start_codon:yes stop_codon:yes gene_type:complete
MVKKAHTIKNNLISTENQYIIFLSTIAEDTIYDKKIANQNEIIFSDSGYQGYKPANNRSIF